MTYPAMEKFVFEAKDPEYLHDLQLLLRISQGQCIIHIRKHPP